jgi:hypothetical protein
MFILDNYYLSGLFEVFKFWINLYITKKALDMDYHF